MATVAIFTGNTLQVAFTQIDSKAPKTPFYFFLKLTGPRMTYSGITDCHCSYSSIIYLKQDL